MFYEYLSCFWSDKVRVKVSFFGNITSNYSQMKQVIS